MALPTSGALTLDAIHVEAGGTTGTTCSLNDTDIRGLTAGAGKTINSTPSTTIDFDDFYGASSVTGFSPTLTVGAGHFSLFSINFRYRGFAVDNSFNNGGPFGALSSRQDANFLNNEDIDILFIIGDLSGHLGSGFNTRMLIRLGTGSSAPNTNASFTSMTVNGTQFNRTDATYSSGNGQWTWDYNSTLANDSTSAYTPMPAVGSTCTVAFA